MRTLTTLLARRAPRILVSTSILALAAISSPARAQEICTYPFTIYPPDLVQSGPLVVAFYPGSLCKVAANTTFQSTSTLPPGTSIPIPGYSGFAFYAFEGGVIDASAGDVSITSSPDQFGAYGAYSNGTLSGAPAQIILGAGTTVTTSGASAYGLFASAGGGISLTGPSSTVTTTGVGAFGLYATGAGSEIAAANGTAIATTGSNANGVQADSDGVVTLNGGSVTVTGTGSLGLYATGTGSQINATNVTIDTNGNAAYAVVADSGGLAKLTGTTIGTTGDGSGGLGINGAASEIDATGVMITTKGGYDSVSGLHSYGVYNGPFGSFATGGVAKLTDTSVSTQGAGMYGVITSAGGSTTILGGSIATAGTLAFGVVSVDGGTTSIASSTLGPTNIVTTGTSANAIDAAQGGAVQLSGAQITTSANGSQGLVVTGSASTLTASGVSVTTKGSIDTTTGYYANGAYNGPGGSDTSGGRMALTDSTIATNGGYVSGVYTGFGGATTITGGSVTTSGQDSSAVVAQNGGTIIVNGGSVTASGIASQGLSVIGAGSTIAASNVAVTTNGGFNPSPSSYSFGILADAGGNATFSGGSVTTNGTIAPGAASVGAGSSVTLSGGATILTTGAGSVGLLVNATGASLTATGVTVTTQGNVEPTTGDAAIGAYNGFAPDGAATGGTMNLTNVTLTTTGSGAIGVEANSGGVTNVSGGSVATAGQDAHALFVTGSGSTANLSGTNTFATLGNGAIGLYATLGGVISATGSATITTAGGVSPATSLGAYGVNADGAGSQIKLGAATITTSGAGATALFASDAASSGSGGSITASGTLAVKTTNAAATAVALQGNGASILATGGGSIASAGNAIAFLGGTGQTATFDNFTIANLSANLIFADPSVSIVNFNSTVADAGANDLLDATAGSVITMNANASTLTGAIRTDPTSTSNVNLANGTMWNLMAPSTVTNLSVTNSVVVFAPPNLGQAFKTLTVNNYVGSGANITLNALLGGSNSSSDQIVINGGKATGATVLSINNVGGLGGQTTGAGIPIVVAVNGGTTASNAFALTNTPVVGGYKYTLEESDQDWYLVSSPTSTAAEIANSISNDAKAQLQQIITGSVLTSILLGATEQVNCSNCSSGFGSIGSYALGAHGRWSLSDPLTLMGGFSYDEYSASGITVTNAPTFAGSLVYDPVNFGRSRPYFEIGGGATPYEQVHYNRFYPSGYTISLGQGTGTDRSLGAFGRVGWVDRVTPIDEAAVYTDISRNWLIAGGYTEAANGNNPFPATVQTGLDTLNVWRVGGQYTHLFNGKFEANVSAAVAYGFGAGIGSQWNVYDFGPIAPFPIANSVWYEWGARVGYRVANRMVIDAFLLGTVGGEIGTTFHGGIGLRYLF